MSVSKSEIGLSKDMAELIGNDSRLLVITVNDADDAVALNEILTVREDTDAVLVLPKGQS